MGWNISTALPALLALLLVSAGIEDARTRNIANWKNAAVALLAPAWWWASGYALWPDVGLQLLLATVVFALFVGAFAIGQMGGGDVKLIGALALWLPLHSVAAAFQWMALLGGALTAVMIADKWVRDRATPPRPSLVGAALALAFATGATLLRTPRSAAWLAEQPFLQLALVLLLLADAALLLTMCARAARRRGITPETPYGVAIAIAALLFLPRTIS